MRLNPNSTDQSVPRVMHAGNMAMRLLATRPYLTNNQSAQESSVTPFFFPPPLFLNQSLLLLSVWLFLPYTRSSLILSLQIYPPVFSLVIKSCQAEVGLHSIIPRSSHICCGPEESRHNTHHLLSAKYVGEFCRIFTQSHSVPFINYHITKEAHLLCMVCCLGAHSNSPL